MLRNKLQGAALDRHGLEVSLITHSGDESAHGSSTDAASYTLQCRRIVSYTRRLNAHEGSNASPMRFCRRISAGLVLLIGLGPMSYAADLKIVLLDGKSGHPLHWKQVCVSFPAGNAPNPAGQSPECHRTDSIGTVEFPLPDPVPETVNIVLMTNGLVECFAPRTFPLAEAMKAGVVAKNTCGDASTDLTETGEVVLFGHQKSLWRVLRSWDEEF
ncbi:MAG: hypothetical protein ABR902_05325 [Candidatus Korobacteraceae bacterium]